VLETWKKISLGAFASTSHISIQAVGKALGGGHYQNKGPG